MEATVIEPGKDEGGMGRTGYALGCCQVVFLRGFHVPPTVAAIKQAAGKERIALALVLSHSQSDSLENLEAAGFKKVASYKSLEDGYPAYLMVKAPKYHMVRSLKSTIKAAVARKPRKSR